MADEKIAETGANGNDLPDEKAPTSEKTVEVNAHEHEPYDATTLNVTGGELPLHPSPRGDHGQTDLKEEIEQEEILDLYQPFPIDPTIQQEEHILTLRSLLTGVILGCLVNCSNLYLGN
jgi:hypothetical protein